MAKNIKNIKSVEVQKPLEKVAEVSTAKTVRYLDKNIKISPRKLRLLATSIKKIQPQIALIQLKFTNSKSARILSKAVQNVIATAKNNYSLIPENLKFDSIRVDEGLKIKRMDKSHGSRFSRGLIQKRHSRLEIIVKAGATK